MLADRFNSDAVGQFRGRHTSSSLLQQQFARGVNNFLTPTIANRNIHAHARVVFGGFLRTLKTRAKLVRQQVQMPHHAHAAIGVGLRKLVDNIADDVEQQLQF